MLAPLAAAAAGVPPGSKLFSLLFVVAGSAAIWIPATLLTPAEDGERLRAFYLRVRPPPWGWRPVSRAVGGDARPWGAALGAWLAGTAGIYALLFGIGGLTLGKGWAYVGLVAAGALILAVLVGRIRKDPEG